MNQARHFRRTDRCVMTARIALLSLAIFSMVLSAVVTAHILVAAATWAHDLLGGWLWVLVALGVGEVGRREMRRAR